MRDAQFEALAEAAEEGIDRDGLRVERADGGYAFATPAVERRGLTEAELRDFAAEHHRYVTNWYYWERVLGEAGDARTAFLRWVERAPTPGDGDEELPVPERYDALAAGVDRTWGQLRIRTTVGSDGLRRHELRHVDDAAGTGDGGDGDPGEPVDADGLNPVEDPRDLRELVKTDERGRYRPLKTAPSLVDGWALRDLDGPDLVRAVEYVYPATVANWYRERTGMLDVTHWRDCAERQTGIYDVIDELDPEAVGWIAEACCVDSQCLKRREWEYDAETQVDVDGGDGAFPCREPCSLVIAAARTWALLERETPRTYEFELTPGEKEQLEAIVEAVADGRVEDVREGDLSEGANRYRARYLRAKRFDDGALCGVPTEE